MKDDGYDRWSRELGPLPKGFKPEPGYWEWRRQQNALPAGYEPSRPIAATVQIVCTNRGTHARRILASIMFDDRDGVTVSAGVRNARLPDPTAPPGGASHESLTAQCPECRRDERTKISKVIVWARKARTAGLDNLDVSAPPFR